MKVWVLVSREQREGESPHTLLFSSRARALQFTREHWECDGVPVHWRKHFELGEEAYYGHREWWYLYEQEVDG